LALKQLSTGYRGRAGENQGTAFALCNFGIKAIWCPREPTQLTERAEKPSPGFAAALANWLSFADD